MAPEFLYKIVLTKNKEAIAEIDWGHHPHWAEQYSKEFDIADTLWLIPKQAGSPLRNVSVKLGNGRRWILFSRVYGSTSAGLDRQVRIYAVGWQETVGGVNRKSLVWVYPSGEIEVADEPSYASVFLNMVNGDNA